MFGTHFAFAYLLCLKVRPLPGAVSHNLAREGLIKLRDSSDRFYIPHYRYALSNISVLPYR